MKYIVIVILFFPVVSFAAMSIGGDAGIIYRDNIGNARADEDIQSGASLNSALTVSRLFIPASSQRITIGVRGEVELFDDFQGMNFVGLGAELAWQKRFGLGPYAPELKFTSSIQKINFDEDVRDSLVYNLGASLEKRINQSLRLNILLNYQDRQAETQISQTYNAAYDIDAFSLENTEFRVGLTYELENQHLVGFFYQYRTGESVSSTQPGSTFFSVATALVRDRALGDNFVAYRLDSSSDTYGLNWNIPVGIDSSVDFSVEWRDTSAVGNNNYKSKIVRASFQHNF